MMIRSFVAVARRTSSIVVKRTLAPPSQPISIQDLGRLFCTQPSNEGIKTENCGTIEDDDDDIEWEDMVIVGPGGAEYGGPTRGGTHKEPTRFGDWERRGRCSDF